MMLGTLLGGKYRLTRQIGTGAMGVVWAAVNESIAREVALKLIRQPNDELRRRLLLEARACGALKHKNIIEVYDVGETAEGDPFLVMQLLSGETLAELLERQRRLDPPHAARIARDVALALVAAHGAGIIHRDLKPANIFLHDEADADGTPLKTVKVLDFGVSKSLSPESPDGLATVTGVIGSPAYMSPEQARRQRRLDHRADLWSVGVTLFEMLTGERPFQGDERELLTRILVEPVPLVSRFVRHIDPGLVALVSRCLERDPARRAQTAAEVAEALKPHCDASEPLPSAPLVPGRVTTPRAAAPAEAPSMDADDAITARLEPRALVALVHQVTPRSSQAALPNAEAPACYVLQKTEELEDFGRGAPAPVPEAISRPSPGATVGLKKTIRMAPDHTGQHAAPTFAEGAGARGSRPATLPGPPVDAPTGALHHAPPSVTPHLVAGARSGPKGRAGALDAWRSPRLAGALIGLMVGFAAAAVIVVRLHGRRSQADAATDRGAVTIVVEAQHSAAAAIPSIAATAASPPSGAPAPGLGLDPSAAPREPAGKEPSRATPTPHVAPTTAPRAIPSVSATARPSRPPFGESKPTPRRARKPFGGSNQI